MYNVFARHTKWTPGILTSYPEEALGCSSSLWLYNPPCLCVWKSAGSAGLGSAIAHTTAELLSTACLLSSLHRDWKCPSPEPNRNRIKNNELKRKWNRQWMYEAIYLPICHQFLPNIFICISSFVRIASEHGWLLGARDRQGQERKQLWSFLEHLVLSIPLDISKCK